MRESYILARDVELDLDSIWVTVASCTLTSQQRHGTVAQTDGFAQQKAKAIEKAISPPTEKGQAAPNVTIQHGSTIDGNALVSGGGGEI